MVHSAVYSGKDGVSRIFDHIYAGNKISCLAHQKLTGFKPNLEMSVVFLFKPFEILLATFFPNFSILVPLSSWFVRNFKSSTKIQEFQFFKLPCNIK